MSLQPTLEFAAAHVPSLVDGAYTISVRQEVTDVPGAPTTRVPAGTGADYASRVHVVGPDVELKPAWIAARFPQPGQRVHHAGVLAHIALNRTTLPYERDALLNPRQSQPVPWLALLQFNDEELEAIDFQRALDESDTRPGVRKLTRSALRRQTGLLAVRGLGEELHDNPSHDPLVRVLELPHATLSARLPAGSGLGKLTHVRGRLAGVLDAAFADELNQDEHLSPRLRSALRTMGVAASADARTRTESLNRQWSIDDDTTGVHILVEAGPGGLRVVVGNRAVVIAPRIAAPGVSHTCFLVSVAGRYEPGPNGDDVARFAGAGATDIVRLVLLDSWGFDVDDSDDELERTMRGLVVEADGTPSPSLQLQLPMTEGLDNEQAAFVDSGHALLRHRLREGGTSIAWYRGPLIPMLAAVGPARQGAAHRADELEGHDTHDGVPVVSQSAAWELGRQLVVANPDVALAIVQWKTAHLKWSHRDRLAAEVSPHLLDPEVPRPPIPTAVTTWAARLALLEFVPANYLIPNPLMLPVESIRGFRVDQRWLRCLLDGVLAAGRMPGARIEQEAEWLDAMLGGVLTAIGPNGGIASDWDGLRLSGVLIRSRLISAWPDIHVDGRSSVAHSVGTMPPAGAILPVLRRARLSENVLLVIYAGDARQVAIHPNAEAIHHGLDHSDASGASVWRSFQDGSTIDVLPSGDLDLKKLPHEPAQVGQQLLASVPRMTVPLP